MGGGQDLLWPTTAALILILGIVIVLVIGAFRRKGSSEFQGESDMGASHERYEQLVAERQMLPLPATIPERWRGIPLAHAEEVRREADAMRNIGWGTETPTVSEAELRHEFDAAIGRVSGAQVDYAQFPDIAYTFARMPAPYCYVGAAEIMRRLSYSSSFRYVPDGLFQALVFAAHAQCSSPLQPDALITQLKILSSVRDPEWARLATQTLHLLERVAPDHPRLAGAKYGYYLSRREYEQALASCTLAQQQAPTQQERAEAMKAAGDLLLSWGGRLEQALEAYDVALAHDPTNAWTWHNKSSVLLRLGRPQEAFVCNDRALRLATFEAAVTMRRKILTELQFRGEEPPQTLEQV